MSPGSRGTVRDGGLLIIGHQASSGLRNGSGVALKKRRIWCRECGERVTVLRGERGPLSAYCETYREQRKRAPRAALRARRGTTQG